MQQLENRLAHYTEQGLSRTLQVANNIDFSSNDYLGFAQDAVLRERFLARLQEAEHVGATASRLLRGNLPLHEETEKLLAQFVDREAALLFPSGYTANIALLSAILHTGDIVFSDALNHASLIDGIQLSKAEKVIFPHGDYDFLENQLQNSHQQLKVIVTESVFSMEGSKADLFKLTELAKRYQALLIVDEAHSTGLWGKSLVATLGLTEKVFASTHTAGKALGASGAWVAGSHMLRNYLINFARGFIYSTAPLPALPLLMQETLKFHDEVGHERAIAVRNKAKKLCALLSLAPNDTPIISILIGDNHRAMEVSQYLQKKSWDIRAIRPPTVPQGTARLRITVKWANTDEQLEQLAHDIQSVVGKVYA